MTEGKQTENEDLTAETSKGKTDGADAEVVQKEKEPDLEALLNEYGKETDSTNSRTEDENKEDDEDTRLTNEEIQELRRERVVKANARIDADVKNAVKIARGDSDLPEEADVLIEGLLHQSVASNPKMKAAWEGRAKNPEGWNKILAKQSENFMALIDKVVEFRTGSNSALESAVLSSNKRKPSNDKMPGLGALTRLSDSEYAKLTRG